MSEDTNIVDQARTIILESIRACVQDDYLTTMADKIEKAEPAMVDSWLVLDAVIMALEANEPQNNRSGGLWYKRWVKLASGSGKNDLANTLANKMSERWRAGYLDGLTGKFKQYSQKEPYYAAYNMGRDHQDLIYEWAEISPTQPQEA